MSGFAILALVFLVPVLGAGILTYRLCIECEGNLPPFNNYKP